MTTANPATDPTSPPPPPVRLKHRVRKGPPHQPAATHRTGHGPGNFHKQPMLKIGEWHPSPLGCEKCLVCEGNMTTGSIVICKTTGDGRIQKTLGPCHPGCTPEGLKRKSKLRPIACVHPRFAVTNEDAAEAAAMSNRLLYGEPSGPFAVLYPPTTADPTLSLVR